MPTPSPDVDLQEIISYAGNMTYNGFQWFLHDRNIRFNIFANSVTAMGIEFIWADRSSYLTEIKDA